MQQRQQSYKHRSDSRSHNNAEYTLEKFNQSNQDAHDNYFNSQNKEVMSSSNLKNYIGQSLKYEQYRVASQRSKQVKYNNQANAVTGRKQINQFQDLVPLTMKRSQKDYLSQSPQKGLHTSAKYSLADYIYQNQRSRSNRLRNSHLQNSNKANSYYQQYQHSDTNPVVRKQQLNDSIRQTDQEIKKAQIERWKISKNLEQLYKNKIRDTENFWKEKVNLIQKQHRQQLLMEKTNYENLIDKIRQEQQVIRKKNTQQIEDKIAKEMNRNRQVNSEYQKIFDNLKYGHEVQLSKANQKFQKMKKQLQDGYNKKVGQIRQTLESEMIKQDKLKNTHSNQVFYLKQKHLTQIQALRSDYQVEIKTIICKHQMVITSLREQFKENRSKDEKQKNDQLQRMKQEISKLKDQTQRLKLQNQNLDIKYEQDKSILNSAHIVQIQKLQQQHIEKQKKIQKQCQEKLALIKINEVDSTRVKNKHQMQRLKAVHGKQMAHMKERVDRIERQYQHAIDNLKRDNLNMIENKQKQFKTRVASIKKQHQQEIKHWQRIYSEAVNDYARQCDKIQKQKSMEVKNLKQESRRSIQKTRHQKGRQLNDISVDLTSKKNRIASLQKQLESKSNQLRRCQNHFKQKVSELQSEKKVLSNRIFELQQKLIDLQPRLPVISEQLSELNTKLKTQQMRYNLDLKVLEQKWIDDQNESIKKLTNQYESNNEKQINRIKRLNQKMVKEKEKKHQLELKCLQQKIVMLEEKIKSKDIELKKQRETYKESVESMISNKRSPAVQKTIKNVREDYNEQTLVLKIEKMLGYIKILEEQIAQKDSRIKSIMSTNTELKNQLKSSLLKVNDQMDLKNQLKHLKAKVIGYQEKLRHYSRPASNYIRSVSRSHSNKKEEPKNDESDHQNPYMMKLVRQQIEGRRTREKVDNDYYMQYSPKKLVQDFLQDTKKTSREYLRSPKQNYLSKRDCKSPVKSILKQYNSDSKNENGQKAEKDVRFATSFQKNYV